MNGIGDMSLELVSDPRLFRKKVGEYASERELFIDIETADWWTPKPRVALLQV